MIWTDALKENDAKFEKNNTNEFVTSNASMPCTMEKVPQKLGDLFEDFQLKQVMEATVEQNRPSESSTSRDSEASKRDDRDVDQ